MRRIWIGLAIALALATMLAFLALGLKHYTRQTHAPTAPS
jgi:hypothetical protein